MVASAISFGAAAFHLLTGRGWIDWSGGPAWSWSPVEVVGQRTMMDSESHPLAEHRHSTGRLLQWWVECETLSVWRTGIVLDCTICSAPSRPCTYYGLHFNSGLTLKCAIFIICQCNSMFYVQSNSLYTGIFSRCTYKFFIPLLFNIFCMFYISFHSYLVLLYWSQWLTALAALTLHISLLLSHLYLIGDFRRVQLHAASIALLSVLGEGSLTCCCSPVNRVSLVVFLTLVWG